MSLLGCVLICFFGAVAGLCRTCEIFGASALVLDSLRHVGDKHFQSLSVSSELWLPLLEVQCTFHSSDHDVYSVFKLAFFPQWVSDLRNVQFLKVLRLKEVHGSSIVPAEMERGSKPKPKIQFKL